MNNIKEQVASQNQYAANEAHRLDENSGFGALQAIKKVQPVIEPNPCEKGRY